MYTIPDIYGKFTEIRNLHLSVPANEEVSHD
jgi:hypothetical protein